MCHSHYVTNSQRKERPGDVVAVTSAEPDYHPGDVPQLTSRVRVELRGHAMAYVVRVATGPQGPRLVELTIVGDDANPVDGAALTRIPLQRVAIAAAQWLDGAGGQFVGPGQASDPDLFTRPELARRRRQRITDELLRTVADTVRHAVANGRPVRTWAAEELHTTPGTLDRWVRAAKDRGFLGEDEVPRKRRDRSTPPATS